MILRVTSGVRSDEVSFPFLLNQHRWRLFPRGRAKRGTQSVLVYLYPSALERVVTLIIGLPVFFGEDGSMSYD